MAEFSYKMTGFSYSANADRDVTTSSHWEGSATGYGAVFGTLSVTTPLADAGATSGSCTWVAGAALEDGTSAAAILEGTWQKLEGQHKWTLKLAGKDSNGVQLSGQGEIDLAARTFTGTFEAV